MWFWKKTKAKANNLEEHDYGLDEEHGPKTIVRFQEQFKQENVTPLILLSTLLCALSILMAVFIFLQYENRPKEKYFALYDENKLFAMTPLDKPNMSTTTLLRWSVEAATATYNYNFSNYESKLRSLKQYFTAKGYDNFLDALSKSNNLAGIEDNKLDITSIPKEPPVIIKEKRTPAGYAWLVQAPIQISIRSGSDVKFKDILVEMLIVRIPTNESAKGIGIAQINFSNKIKRN